MTININNTVRASTPTHLQKNFVLDEFNKSKSFTVDTSTCNISNDLSDKNKNNVLKSNLNNYKNYKKNSNNYLKSYNTSKNNDEKPLVSSRSLPCKTYISCGDCPYRDRCTFLHDPLLCSKISISKQKVSDTDNNNNDMFYWKPMSVHQLQKSNCSNIKSNGFSNLKNQKNTNVNSFQHYYPRQSSLFDNNNYYDNISSNYQNFAADSMWSNLTCFCKETEDSRDACKRRIKNSKYPDNIAFIDTTIDNDKDNDNDTNTTLSITARCNDIGSPTHNDISGIKRANIFVRLASGEFIQDNDDQEEEEDVLNDALQHVKNMCTHMHTHAKDYGDNMSEISAVSFDSSTNSTSSSIDFSYVNKNLTQYSLSSSSSSLSLVSVATTLPDESDLASQSPELFKSDSVGDLVDV